MHAHVGEIVGMCLSVLVNVCVCVYLSVCVSCAYLNTQGNLRLTYDIETYAACLLNALVPLI